MRDCSFREVKTKGLICSGKLICIFVFANANCWFSHKVAHIAINVLAVV